VGTNHYPITHRPISICRTIGHDKNGVVRGGVEQKSLTFEGRFVPVYPRQHVADSLLLLGVGVFGEGFRRGCYWTWGLGGDGLVAIDSIDDPGYYVDRFGGGDW